MDVAVGEGLQDLYGVEVSPDLISRVTAAVIEEVKAWQSRPLEAVYPIVYLDALVTKVRDQGTVTNKSAYLAIGVNMGGTKEVLDLWLEGTEGLKFWLKILTELKNRGVLDILILCCDGLKGFPEAIEAVFPKATVQTCIVHMIKNSLGYVAWKDPKAVALLRMISDAGQINFRNADGRRSPATYCAGPIASKPVTQRSGQGHPNTYHPLSPLNAIRSWTVVVEDRPEESSEDSARIGEAIPDNSRRPYHPARFNDPNPDRLKKVNGRNLSP